MPVRRLPLFAAAPMPTWMPLPALPLVSERRIHDADLVATQGSEAVTATAFVSPAGSMSSDVGVTEMVAEDAALCLMVAVLVMAVPLVVWKVSGMDTIELEVFAGKDTRTVALPLPLLGVMVNNLRRGDIVTRLNATQAAFLLPYASEADTGTIVDRLKRSFYLQVPSGCSLSFAFTPISIQRNQNR